MASRLRSAWLTRAAVAVAASAVPLFAAGAAQASIAGGNPATSNNLPVLRSAHTLDASDVQVCFDKAISQSSVVFTPGNYDYLELVGYNARSNDLYPIGVTLDNKNSNCVDAAFNTHSGSLDLGQFTAVIAWDGAVQGSTSGGQTNFADSTTLLDSTTHNGTVGLSSGPDLVGSAPVPTSTAPNSVAFVFDQNVDPTSVSQTGFWYENANGQFCYSDAAAASGTTVVAHFPTTPTSVSGTGNCADTIDGNGTSSVSNARRGGAVPRSVYSVSNWEIPNAEQGGGMPNAANGGATNIASLVSAQLGPESGQVTYTFDHPINAAVTNVNDFFVLLSSGRVIQGCSTCGTPDTVNGGSNANQVVVTYNNYGLQYFDEYAVQAGVDNGAVTATNGSTGTDASSTPVVFTNSPGDAPIGGNSGAFARGFTTGPDMYAVAFDTTHDVATATFDQRVGGYTQSYIRFLNAAGNDIGGPTTVVVPTFPNPGPVTISMSVDPAIMAQNPTQIALGPNGNMCAFRTYAPGYTSSDDCTIPQTVSTTKAAARVKSIVLHHKVVKAHKAHRSHKAHRTHKKH